MDHYRPLVIIFLDEFLDGFVPLYAPTSEESRLAAMSGGPTRTSDFFGLV